MAATILMIEDNPELLRINRAELEDEGYRVFEALTLEDGNRLAREVNPDLILLDILLPDGNGLEYCREQLYKSSACVLFLSALNTKEDVIAGLRAGGDDYIPKPYLMEELLARVEALLRRSKGTVKNEPIFIGNLEIRTASRRASAKGKDLLLKPLEYALLEFLALRSGKFVSAKELYETLWDMDTAGATETVTVHISKLRKKIEQAANVTVESKRKEGYRLIVK